MLPKAVVAQEKRQYRKQPSNECGTAQKLNMRQVNQHIRELDQCVSVTQIIIKQTPSVIATELGLEMGIIIWIRVATVNKTTSIITMAITLLKKGNTRRSP